MNFMLLRLNSVSTFSWQDQYRSSDIERLSSDKIIDKISLIRHDKFNKEQLPTVTNEVKYIRQTILFFKLEVTNDTITCHAGLSLLGEFCVGLDLLGKVDRYLSKPGSGAGYQASEFISPLVLMLNDGARSLEDIWVIRNDTGMREILPLKRVPSSYAIGDWLRRSGAGGDLIGPEKTNRKIRKRGLKYDGIKEYTHDIDTTGIEAQKESAMMTYKRSLVSQRLII